MHTSIPRSSTLATPTRTGTPRLRPAWLKGDRPHVVGFVVALGLATVLVSGPVQTWLEQRDRVLMLETTLTALETENTALADRAAELRDPDHVELAAREQQGMVRPGEVPYVVVPPEVYSPVIGQDRAATTAATDERGTIARLWAAVQGLFSS